MSLPVEECCLYLTRSEVLLFKTKEMCGVIQSALNNIVEGVTELFQVHADDYTTRQFQGLQIPSPTPSHTHTHIHTHTLVFLCT